MKNDTIRVKFSTDIRPLWEEAFGNVSGFLDQFEKYGYDPEGFRVRTEGGECVSALYLFDCGYDGGRVAYIYGVATKKSHRGRGYSTALLEQTHEYLRKKGYAGAILVPASPGLFSFYERLGYKVSSSVTEIDVPASENAVPLYQI